MYVCNNCSYTSITKLGKCPECGKFWTFEKKEEKNTKQTWNILSETKNIKNKFYDLANSELKRVFTHGINSSGVYLLGGQPWIGKSTIVLQLIQSFKENVNVAYFSGEEDSNAVINRYKRLFQSSPDFKIYHSTNLDDIIETTLEEKFQFIIIDSIQTIYSNATTWVAWSVNQVKYCSEKISEFCKKHNIASCIIGHITKSGEIAWPKYLEHIVDTVAYLEWDRFAEYRFLRTQKNRFGPTDDVAIFQMTEKWLIPAYNIKEEIIQNISWIPGTILSVWIDNWRPVLTTIEVLLNKTKYKFPKRSSIWIDNARLEMIIAILERYLNLNLGFMDIYINVPWEFKFFDSWLDLALAMWILSAYYNKTIDKNNIFIWEISLSWKINKTKFHTKREKEAKDFNIIDYKKINNIFW
jgi:DNA repair protein RadA/Sms